MNVWKSESKYLNNSTQSSDKFILKKYTIDKGILLKLSSKKKNLIITNVLFPDNTIFLSKYS